MADKSAIEWTDATWNPIRARNLKTGQVGWHCEHATTGCEFCYAEGFNKRLGTRLAFKPGHRKDIEIFLCEETLLAPLRWKRPRMIFPGSMTDLFADFVRDEWLDKIFAVMALTPQHTYQVLTKRAPRQRAFVSAKDRFFAVWAQAVDLLADSDIPRLAQPVTHAGSWPLPNVWHGVSTERQPEADERIPELLQTPAAVRFISYEPALGPLDLERWLQIAWQCSHCRRFYAGSHKPACPDCGQVGGWSGSHAFNPPAGQIGSGLDWIITGGESGPKARAMHPDWARSLRDQCAAAGVAFFFKQWGEYLPVGQSLPGYGKVHGATAVKPGRMKLHYGGTPQQAPKHAFAKRGVEFASLADGRLTFHLGKKAAGRLLDGVECNDMPERLIA